MPQLRADVSPLSINKDIVNTIWRGVLVHFNLTIDTDRILSDLIPNSPNFNYNLFASTIGDIVIHYGAELKGLSFEQAKDYFDNVAYPKWKQDFFRSYQYHVGKERMPEANMESYIKRLEFMGDRIDAMINMHGSLKNYQESIFKKKFYIEFISVKDAIEQRFTV